MMQDFDAQELAFIDERKRLVGVLPIGTAGGSLYLP